MTNDEVITPARELWKLYVDGSSNENGSGVGIILITPAGSRFHFALRFSFKASNNEVEYEALLAGLRIAKGLRAKAIHCYSDSQLVVNQVLGEYQGRETKMAAYLEKAKAALEHFEYYAIEQVP